MLLRLAESLQQRAGRTSKNCTQQYPEHTGSPELMEQMSSIRLKLNLFYLVYGGTANFRRGGPVSEEYVHMWRRSVSYLNGICIDLRLPNRTASLIQVSVPVIRIAINTFPRFLFSSQATHTGR